MAFKPSVHGFPFPNWWPPGTPVMEVPTPLGTLRIGDASGGVCGGMVFAAAGLLPFRSACRCCRRSRIKPALQVFLASGCSMAGNAPLRRDEVFRRGRRRPTASRKWGGVKLVDGTAFLTTHGRMAEDKSRAGRRQPWRRSAWWKPYSLDPRKRWAPTIRCWRTATR